VKVLIIDASKCPECGSKHIRFNSKTAELFCETCGYVIQEEIPVIDAKYGVSKVYVNPKEKKIAIVVKMLKTNMERKMTPFYAELKKIRLPGYIEAEVIILCKECVNKKLTMSYPKRKLLAALIYLVSKREGVPITIRDLEKHFDIDKWDLLKIAKFLAKKLGIRLNNTSAESYIIRISSEIGKEKLAHEAIKMLKCVKLSHPLIKAAVCIWIASKKMGVKIKKSELAKAAGISELTLRRNIKKVSLC